VKISGIQLFMIIFMYSIGNSLLMYVHPVIHAVGQDAWLSCLVAMIPALAIAVMAIKTGLYNPDLSFLQNCRKLLGKWAGTAVAFVYAAQWTFMLAHIAKFTSDFLIILLLEQTPNWVFIITLLGLAVYAVIAGGIVSLARLSEAFGIVSLIGLVLLILMLVPLARPGNLLPVYADHGWLRITKAAIFPLAFKAEVVWLIAIAPFVDRRDKAPKTVFWAKLFAFVIGTINLLLVILVLSPEVASHQLYPSFDMVSLISIMNFIQNLETVLVLAWLLSVFIRLSLYLFLASHTASELFGIRDFKRAVWIVAGIAVLLAFISLQLKVDILPITGRAWLLYVFPWTLVALPTVLFAAGLIQRKRAKNGQESAA